MFRVIQACVISAAVAVCLSAAPARAVDNEILPVKLPKGFKVGIENKTDKEMTTTMVPAAETVENWTEMVTTQVLYNQRDLTPAQHRAELEKVATEACPGASFAKVKEGTENLYPMIVWTQHCPLNKVTGKPEFIWMKSVQGRDNAYLVQKAFRFEPSPKQVKAVTALLDDAKVCDLRVPGQRCKPGK